MGGRSKILATVGLAVGLAVVPVVATAPAGAATFTAHGSVEQVYVTHAVPGDAVDLRDGANQVVAHGTVDDLGSFLFREVAPGDGYTVIDGGESSAPLHVMTRAETPPQSFYTNQHLADGFGYITTRDGTKLSAEITLPGPADQGPYPTVIEYSGYDPSHPGHPQPSTLISQLLGYATVGVNVRGTGCSGGAFQFFEPLSALDGYDVVEAVAAQPWVAHGAPGMVGISYPGIAQTFVAPTRPPHLAAIAPLSVMADAYRSLSYPGGIPNIGFPREWSQDRDDNARPYGQGWEHSVVDAGGPNGAQCAENQLLRHESTSLVNTFDTHPYREPVGGADTLSPGADSLSPQFLDTNINVPVFMGGAWQDEQTGGQSSLIWEHLGGLASQHKLFGTNGTHVDSLVAELNRWFEFLEFYVARRIPNVPANIRAIAPIIFQQATGISAYSSNRTGSRSTPRMRLPSPPTRANRQFACCSRTARATRRISVRRSVRTRCTSRRGRPRTFSRRRGTSNPTSSSARARRTSRTRTDAPRRRINTTRRRNPPPTSTAVRVTSGPRILRSIGAYCRSAKRSRSIARH